MLNLLFFPVHDTVIVDRNSETNFIITSELQTVKIVSCKVVKEIGVR